MYAVIEAGESGISSEKATTFASRSVAAASATRSLAYCSSLMAPPSKVGQPTVASAEVTASGAGNEKAS